MDGALIDFQGGSNNLGGMGMPQPMGFIDFPQPPALPVLPQQKPFNYPAPNDGAGAPPFNYNIPPQYPPLNDEKKDLNTQFLSVRRICHFVVPPHKRCISF